MTPTAAARVRTAPAGPAPGLRARPQSTPRPRRAPAIAPRVPRRVSGPARLRRAAGPALALSELPLLDRLIKGRAWIGLVAFALIGIVTMQLALLKLNAGIGRALVHENALQRENSALSVEASEAQNPDTVELRAGQLGMQFVAPGTLRFLPAQGGESDVARAVAALNADAARAAGADTSGGSTGSSGEGPGGAAGEGSEASTASGEATSADGETGAGAEAQATTGAGVAAAPGGEGTAAAGEASAAPAGEGKAGEASAAPAGEGTAGQAADSAGAVTGESSESSASGAADGSASPQG